MERKYFWITWLTIGILGGLSSCVTTDGEDETDTAEDSGPPVSFFPTDLMNHAQGGGMTQPAMAPEGSSYAMAKWEENPALALSKAEALDRPLVILFTAMSWNDNASKLSKEVFATRSFNSFARENAVMTFMDFPQNANRVPESYEKFKEHYDITGYPTFLLIDPKTRLDVYRKVGYQPGRAKDYFLEIRQAILDYRGIPVTDWQPDSMDKVSGPPERAPVSGDPALTSDELTP